MPSWKNGDCRGGSPEQTPFDCHLHQPGDEGSLVSVDVVTPGPPPAWDVPNARGFVPLPRLFDLPAGKLVILEEQGRLVLCAGAAGRLVHSQIVSATRDLNGHAAPEIRIASLALQQQGVVPEITGVELWGDFSVGDAQELSEQLKLPVQARVRARPRIHGRSNARPAPSCSRPRRALALGLRRRHQMRWAAVAAVALLGLWWGFAQRAKLAALERRAAQLEGAVSAASGETGKLQAEQDRVRAAQERWAALHLALEPRRYPLMILNGLTRCIPAGGVVLGRFESKVSELSAAGTARSAMEAYTYFNAVSQDKELGVYGWSMVQPAIAADGTATFELKGQMR